MHHLLDARPRWKEFFIIYFTDGADIFWDRIAGLRYNFVGIFTCHYRNFLIDETAGSGFCKNFRSHLLKNRKS
jgi:hypothetical protein